jgi:dsDNA-binding SOS-regulon protein
MSKHNDAINEMQRFIAIASGQDPDTFKMRAFTKEEAKAYDQMLNKRFVKEEQIFEEQRSVDGGGL